MTNHPLAELFPPMSADEYAQLKASIEAKGQLEPIVLAQGQVIDGRHRLRACTELGRAPVTIEYMGNDLIGYVIARNAARRHLDESQRAMVSAKIANLNHGGDRKSNQDPNSDLDPQYSVSEAAALMHVGRSAVADARKVLATAAPDLITAVERGTVAVSAAKEIAVLPERDQQVIALTPDGPVRRQHIKDAKARAKEQKAHEREAQDAKPLELTQARADLAPAERTYTVVQWDKLSKVERRDIIDAGFACRTKMNDQTSAAIEWAQRSLNTVTGCLHDCPYCYARDIANSPRMRAVYPQRFAPTFHPSRLAAPSNEAVPTEAQRDPAFRNVFANSMSDLFGAWVPREWIEATIEMARRNPTWNFLTLTKFPQRAAEFTFPVNWWMGTTVDAQARVANAERAFAKIVCGTKWLSVEPLLEPLTFTKLELFQWIVIGGASASEKTPAWVPPLLWMAQLQVAAHAAGLRVYHKTNTCLPDTLRCREFPWTRPDEKPLPKVFRYLKGMG